jgi:hypothetical protein
MLRCKDHIKTPFGCCNAPSCVQAVGRDAEIGEAAIQRFIAAQFAAVAAGSGGGDGQH